MRRAICVCLLAACGSSPAGDGPFDDSGGTLAIANCGYSVTTKFGAEAPKPSGGVIGKDPTPEFVHLGFVGDPKTTMVAQWRTADETTNVSMMRYGEGSQLTADQLKTTIKGIDFRYQGTGTAIYRMHQAHACGLTPNTTYSYQVGDGKHWSQVGTFHTAPDVTATPDAEVVLGWVGDSRLHYDVWGQVAAQLVQRSPDVLLFSGDAIFSGLDQAEWDEWLTAGADLLANVPIVLANGNHEANAINFYSQFAMPGDQENFGMDYGWAHLTVANDTPEDATLTTTTKDALAADLAASASARWKLLMHHQPMWSSGSTHGSNLTLQASWGPVVDQYAIDLVLNGHEHNYEVTKPLNGGMVQTTNATGTVYVISGGAGADLYPFVTNIQPWSQYTEVTHSAAVLHVRRDQLTLDAFRDDGTTIPTGFTKTKP